MRSLAHAANRRPGILRLERLDAGLYARGMSTADNTSYSASHSTAHSDADTDGARWMTFAELAEARGIDKRSAVVLVRRHGWRRQRNNEGHVIALVPADWAHRETDSAGYSRGHSQTDNAADTSTYAATTFETTLAAIEAAHAGELAAVRRERDAAERAQLAAQTVTDQTLAQLADATARGDRAEAALAGERARADVLRDRLDVLQADLAVKQTETMQAEARARTAEEAAETLRRAEVERRARGLVARLRAVLRGE